MDQAYVVPSASHVMQQSETSIPATLTQPMSMENLLCISESSPIVIHLVLLETPAYATAIAAFLSRAVTVYILGKISLMPTQPCVEPGARSVIVRCLIISAKSRSIM